MKVCIDCKEQKPLCEFGVHSGHSDGKSSRCLPCARKKSAEYRAKNKDKYLKTASEKYWADPEAGRDKSKRNYAKHADSRRASAFQKYHADVEKAKKANRSNYEKHRAARLAQAAEYYRRTYHKNKYKVLEKTKARQASKIRATPTWDRELTKFIAEQAYELSAMRRESTSIIWEIDHIVPLKSDQVCGLHVWTNLRVIPKAVNRSKGNKLIEGEVSPIGV